MAPRLKYKNIEFLKKLGNSDKPSLTKINKVLEILNNPHKNNMGIKIAISGTNGKGSVAKSLSEILNKSKYRVGLYTSPHIFDINEILLIVFELNIEEFNLDNLFIPLSAKSITNPVTEKKAVESKMNLRPS